MTGDQACGPNMAQLTSMNQAAGSTAGAQMWLGGWIACLDFKPLVNPIAEIIPFFSKQCLPGANVFKYLPCMPQGHLAKILGEIFSGGFQIEDFAGMTQEEIQYFMRNNSEGIEESDGLLARLGNLSAKNVAMSQAMLDQDGHALG